MQITDIFYEGAIFKEHNNIIKTLDKNTEKIIAGVSKCISADCELSEIKLSEDDAASGRQNVLTYLSPPLVGCSQVYKICRGAYLLICELNEIKLSEDKIKLLAY